MYTTEVNYTIRIHTPYGLYYFTKESIYLNNDSFYNIFTDRYPILKTLSKKDIIFTECWRISHPGIIRNSYTPFYEFVNNCYINWMKEKEKEKCLIESKK